MIYPEKEKLDLGNNIELRISKTDKLRTMNYELENNLKKYIAALQMLIHAEKKIQKSLEFLYQGNTSYESLILDLRNCIDKKEEIINKEISSLKEAMKNKKKIEEQFKPIRPYIKEYFKKRKKLTHYNVKLPKLIKQLDAKEKLKGQLSEKEVKKKNRNQKKLRDAQSSMQISSENIIKETNKLNLERFKFFNPIVGEYISSNLSLSYLM